MGRPKGAKNRRTILREAEQHLGSKYVDQVLDSLYVIETGMRHFFIRAEMGKNAGREEALVGQDYKDAATLAAMVAPYRHARLSAVKLAGDPNNPARFKDDATADELRAELMKRLEILTSAGLIDLRPWLIMFGTGLASIGLQAVQAQVTIDVTKITCEQCRRKVAKRVGCDFSRARRRACRSGVEFFSFPSSRAA